MILPRKFFLGDTTEIAKSLLGKRLVRNWKGRLLSGVIVETEAYLGLNDPACHSFHGKKTPRVEAMYRPGGHTYVYLIYGMHWCFNVVTGDERRPEAVLIRALEPDLDSIALMQQNRIGKTLRDLTNGPAKLCEALRISKSLNGLDMTFNPTLIWIEESGASPSRIIAKTRIGIDSKGNAAKWPLRFYLPRNPFISRL